MNEKYSINIPREDIWNKDNGQDFDKTKVKILSLLKEQKVSLSEIRYLFNNILTDIERYNPTTL